MSSEDIYWYGLANAEIVDPADADFGWGVFIHVVGVATTAEEFIELVGAALEAEHLRPIELDDIEPLASDHLRTRYFRDLRREVMHGKPVALGSKRHLYPMDGEDK